MPGFRPSRCSLERHLPLRRRIPKRDIISPPPDTYETGTWFLSPSQLIAANNHKRIGQSGKEKLEIKFLRVLVTLILMQLATSRTAVPASAASVWRC